MLFTLPLQELLTHERPYFHIKIEAQVILAIAQGARPTRPASPWFKSLEPYGTFLWLICQSCWVKDPAKRFTMLDVIRELDSATFSDSKHPLMLVSCFPFIYYYSFSYGLFRIAYEMLLLQTILVGIRMSELEQKLSTKGRRSLRTGCSIVAHTRRPGLFLRCYS